MKSATTTQQPATPPPENNDWGDEPCLPSDLHAMREGERAAAERRLIPDAAIGRMLRQRERNNGITLTQPPTQATKSQP